MQINKIILCFNIHTKKLPASGIRKYISGRKNNKNKISGSQLCPLARVETALLDTEETVV